MAAEYKVLGQLAPSNTTAAALYTVPSGKEAVVSSLVIANITKITGSAATVEATVWVRPGGASVVNQHILVPQVPVGPGTAPIITAGFTLAEDDVVTVKTSAGDGLAFHLFGTEI